MFALGKKYNIGLDIGHDRVKVALVDVGRGVIWKVWSMQILKARQTKDQMPTEEDLQKCIIDIITLCRKEGVSFKKGIAASIYGGGSICQYVELPALKPRELATAVPSQAIKYVPFPMDKVTLSYIQVPPIAGGSDKTAVFFIAEQNEPVAFVKNLLKGIGVELNRIETPALALPREFARDHKPDRTQFVALIYIGFMFTYVIMIRERYPYFAREIGLAGRDFTYAFQMGIQSSWQDAEDYKLRYDVLTREIPMEPFLTRWVDEIKRSLGFFEKQFGGNSNLKIEKAVLTGGSAGLVNLDKRLSDSLGIPVTVDRWELMKCKASLDQNPATYNVAVGLALE